ncbi:MAG: sulfatase [Nitrospirota bacterium]
MNRPNILLISIDTLRADHLSCYGYHRKTTPNIDKLASEGTIFRQNYSTGVWTPPGHASMLTGLYVSEHGVYGERKLADNVPTIATILKENAYQTAGFVNNSQVGELVGFEKGHDTFVEVWKGVQSKSIVERIIRGGIRKIRKYLSYEDMGAKRTNKIFSEWIEGIDKYKPFYCFLHYIEPHNPLNPPRPYKNKYLTFDVIARSKATKQSTNIDMKKINKVALNPLICYVEDLNLNQEEISYIKNLYDGEVAYTDHIVGEIISILKRHNLYDNTMIVVTSDHGEHFGERGLWSHVASLYKEVLHIPLIIKYPRGVEHINEVNEYTQLVDIFPTVLKIAGLSLPPLLKGGEGGLSGVSLVYDKNNNINKYHKYIFAEWEGRIPYFIQDKVEAKAKAKVEDKSKGEDILNRFKTPMSMIQDKQYKYIYKSDGNEELYDISNGKEELLNITTQKELKDRLCSELFKKQRYMRDIEESTTYSIDDEIARNLKALGYM